MATKPTTVLAAMLALGCVLAGCSSETPAADPTASDTATPTATPTPTTSATPTPDPTPTEKAPDPADADALPPGFPDPDSLIGQEAYDEQGADGIWHVVVGGQPLDLPHLFGSCFDGGAGDVCAYSISGSAPRGADGAPAPTEAALLLLLRSTGARADGTLAWLVLDAVVTRTPDGEPAFLDACDGASGVAIYADADAAPGATVPVVAAWGPNAGVSAIVELDPASVTCAYAGD